MNNGCGGGGQGGGGSPTKAPGAPRATMKSQESSQTKFLWTVAMMELVLLAIYLLLVRYDDSADPLKALKTREARDHLRCLHILNLLNLKVSQPQLSQPQLSQPPVPCSGTT